MKNSRTRHLDTRRTLPTWASKILIIAVSFTVMFATCFGVYWLFEHVIGTDYGTSVSALFGALIGFCFIPITLRLLDNA